MLLGVILVAALPSIAAVCSLRPIPHGGCCVPWGLRCLQDGFVFSADGFVFSVPTQCTVQVKLELGHRAQLRKKPTTEGFTHDWMVFVRGPEQCDIQHFVERVVFRLHESFPKPKRGQRGWACFICVKEVVLNCHFFVKYLLKKERNIHCVRSSLNLSPACLRKVRENGTFLLLKGQEVSCFLLLFKH